MFHACLVRWISILFLFHFGHRGRWGGEGEKNRDEHPRIPITPPTRPVKAIVEMPFMVKGALTSQQSLESAVQVCWRGRWRAVAVAVIVKTARKRIMKVL